MLSCPSAVWQDCSRRAAMGGPGRKLCAPAGSVERLPIRHVLRTPTPLPCVQRKAYLRQNIMASHYIVAQQRRMSGSGGSSTAATPTSLAAAGLQDRLSLRAAPQAGSAGCACAPGGAVAAAVATAQQQQQEGQRERQEQQQGAAPAAPQQRQQGAARRAPALPHYHNAAEGVLGCKHYRRRCMLVAPCCDTPYVCRLCHDEAADHQVSRQRCTPGWVPSAAISAVSRTLLPACARHVD